MTSAEILAELRASRPAAPAALRARVDAIATVEPRRSWAQPPRDRLARALAGRRTLWVALPAAAVLAVASAGAIGLVEGGSRDGDVLATGAREATQESAKVGQDAITAAPATGAAGAVESAPAPTPGRAQRVSATLTVKVRDTDALSGATQEALDVTRSLGGYVVSVSYATAEDGSASLLLRVPTEAVQDAITRLSSLGTIVAQQVQIDDLQEQIDQLGRRVTALRTQIARLSAQLADPDLSREQRATLTARRAAARDELAAVTAERGARTSEAALATVQLTLLTEQGAAAPPVPSRIDRALDEAGRILAWEAAIALYAIVVAGPLVLFLAVLWWGQRMLARRADERLLEAS
ncbi:MAG: DUF4349 domain-containing protein [Thermoleophilia bacterium]|nr:DUF4349 domain-containing protein [Thermoleophilia bacterium]MDH4345093.1 DUF4349 domain-containing protein [Thermoleophilia bacterium]MDH5332906.1 DUF4349 domain-containing protein [Thermoleophilia bacterium]